MNMALTGPESVRKRHKVLPVCSAFRFFDVPLGRKSFSWQGGLRAGMSRNLSEGSLKRDLCGGDVERKEEVRWLADVSQALEIAGCGCRPSCVG